jgi:hypothetical protein
MTSGLFNGGRASWNPAIIPLIGLAALTIVCILAKTALVLGLSWQCPVMSVLHLPCPSCGSTRALAALSEFQILEALRFNPLIVLSIPAAPIAYLFRNKLAGSRAAWSIFLGAVFTNWLYLLFFLPR